MKMIPLGNTGIEVSSVIMGTWQAGHAMWADIEDRETAKAMQAAFDAGVTTFDTAPVYGNGYSERIVGEALRSFRQEAVIATKVFSHSLAKDKVVKSCHQSLRDLKTDYIDLLQIHWPAGTFGSKKVPVDETLTAMAKLKEEGKIRAVGVSNFSLEQLQEAREFGEIVSLQPPYNLFWRHAEEAMPHCAENGIAVLAYSPLAQGILTGKFGPEPVFGKGDHRAKNRLFSPEHYGRVCDALKQLEPIARRNDLTLAQLALAWVISHPNTCAIAGARNAEQAAANAASGDITLSHEDLTEMDTVSRSVTDHLDDNPVQWEW